MHAEYGVNVFVDLKSEAISIFAKKELRMQ
jgi:hypothetical protein